ncbi:MAG: protein-L-isoaspartate(D-aspartate) O-methyltransferase [Ginsengibacter sp.]
MRHYEDTYRHKGMRKKLIDSLREKGVIDENVLEAMMSVPRHFFLDNALDQKAYEDKAFPIAEGQTISQPYTVAYQTALLKVKPYEKILEIGTGSAYQATVLGEMKANVYTIERQRKLFELTKEYVFKSKYPNIKFFYGDGFEGLPTYAPFDKILITAAAPEIPPRLLSQLSVGGLMIIPLNTVDNLQQMMRITKNEDGISEEIFHNFSFVPMLKGKSL